MKIIVGGSGVVRESESESLDVFRRLFSTDILSLMLGPGGSVSTVACLLNTVGCPPCLPI